MKEKFLVIFKTMSDELVEANSYKEALEIYIEIKKKKNECHHCFECTDTKHVHRWVEN